MTITLKARAYAYLRDKLLMGTMVPGARISELELSREMGMSRTPVREALAQLETQGLIEQEPGFGPRVRTLDRRGLEESIELREMLECGAAPLAARRITDGELAALTEICDQYESTVRRVGESGSGNPLNWQLSILDMAFHLKIIEAVKNRSLLRAVGDAHLLTRVLWRRADLPHIPHSERLSHVCTDHREILRALQQRDGDSAQASLRRHIQWARDCHFQAFDWEERQRSVSQNDDPGSTYFPQHVLEILGRMERGGATSGVDPLEGKDSDKG